ncbi:MAG: hypothetical protein KHZ77_07940 [Veillonella sp.]|uniref:hypothetical protein n=1 Tax=Veillonella sp. TaxID=1926307 RepID=UPI0025DB7967|nr:hypothetical protein [Veillonella sp.]MBS4914063.1 hypothetical protein [Veillonella sp.]
MKIAMEERLRNWGFHEEDIPDMLKELEKLPSIEREEEVLIAEAALQALVKVKLPNYNGHQGFITYAERLCHTNDKNEVELTYDMTIPRWDRRLAIREIKDIITDEMTESDWSAVIDKSRDFIMRTINRRDNRSDADQYRFRMMRMLDNGLISLYLNALRQISEEAFKRAMEDEFIRAEVFKERYIVEHLEL